MRDILAYADSFETWSHALEYAARLAAARKAALTGVYVYPTPDYMMPAYGASALLSTIVEQAHRIERESLAAEERFVAWARAQGVGHACWQVAEGFVPDALGYLGNWHDLLVLQRNREMLWESAADLGAVVLGAELPCIVVPPGTHDGGRIECVALAWNGAPEGVRAIHAARPLLASARRIVLLKGRRRDPLGDLGWRPEFDIEAYLRAHGFTIEVQAVSSGDADAGEALLGAARSVAADLLVMGAYGRSRFSEWIFGGATRHVLEHATLPVLMRH